MSKFIIHGGRRLQGEITPQGAKNEALQVISATLLTSEKVVIHNIPDILDIRNLIALLGDIGVKIERLGPSSYSFQADEIDTEFIAGEKLAQRCSSLRGSLLVVGPILARFGKAYFPRPGGDKIGRRKVDTHITGLIKLGAEFSVAPDNRCYILESPAGGLKGTYMLLDEASVTGTANIVMAASLAEGATTIYNAACEPYVQQLCRLLVAMGVRIDGIGSNLLTVHGCRRLGGAVHRVLPDMIEVGSFIGMAAMTRSSILIRNVSHANLGIIPECFRRLGITIDERGEDLYVKAADSYGIESNLDGSVMTVADAPWPGLTPDLLSVMLVVATQCKGEVLIHQKMFESRLFFVDHLIDMGAKIILCDPHRAVVIGLDHQSDLKPNHMHSPDIRAGIAMLIAAMSAKGTSIIDNIEQIDRGYERIDERIRALGADITRAE